MAGTANTLADPAKVPAMARGDRGAQGGPCAARASARPRARVEARGHCRRVMLEVREALAALPDAFAQVLRLRYTSTSPRRTSPSRLWSAPGRSSRGAPAHGARSWNCCGERRRAREGTPRPAPRRHAGAARGRAALCRAVGRREAAHAGVLGDAGGGARAAAERVDIALAGPAVREFGDRVRLPIAGKKALEDLRDDA
jgi:hypothetical protein